MRGRCTSRCAWTHGPKRAARPFTSRLRTRCGPCAGRSSMTDDLDRRCEAFGIALSYHDIWGNEHATPEATKRALLDAMHAASAAPQGGQLATSRALRCRLPSPHARLFGPAIQLYAIRSR